MLRQPTKLTSVHEIIAQAQMHSAPTRNCMPSMIAISKHLTDMQNNGCPTINNVLILSMDTEHKLD